MAGLEAGLSRRRVLILCTGNSCRSQMAEAWVRLLSGERWEACSAGTHPAATVHPLAVRAMSEVGVDIASARPQSVERHLSEPWDLVITVCDAAAENCPRFPGPAPRRHVAFDDPALATGSEEERMRVFRRVRDEIRERLVPLLDDAP